MKVEKGKGTLGNRSEKFWLHKVAGFPPDSAQLSARPGSCSMTVQALR